MKFSIFSNIDINALSEEDALSELQKYQQLAQSIVTKYQQINRVISRIDDNEEAKTVSFAFTDFNTKFRENAQAINSSLQEKTRNLSLAAEKIKEYDDIFNSVEPFYEKHNELFVSSLKFNDEDYSSYQVVKNEIIDRLNEQWATLQNNLSNKIDEGIQSVLDIKLTLGVTGAFKDQIESEITRNRKASSRSFKQFIFTLILIPLTLGATYSIDAITNLEWQEALMLRLSIALPLIWIAKWCSTNYTYSRVAEIKFDHLYRLLGEGAPTIAKLVEADPDAKSEVYKRFAELFLDINDLTSFSGNQPKHPVEDLKEALDIHKKLKELIK